MSKPCCKLQNKPQFIIFFSFGSSPKKKKVVQRTVRRMVKLSSANNYIGVGWEGVSPDLSRGKGKDCSSICPQPNNWTQQKPRWMGVMLNATSIAGSRSRAPWSFIALGGFIITLWNRNTVLTLYLGHSAMLIRELEERTLNINLLVKRRLLVYTAWDFENEQILSEFYFGNECLQLPYTHIRGTQQIQG